MNVVSASGEPDAGTRYPSLIEDSNGNTIAAFSELAASHRLSLRHRYEARLHRTTSALWTTSSCCANLNYQTKLVPFPNSARPRKSLPCSRRHPLCGGHVRPLRLLSPGRNE